MAQRTIVRLEDDLDGSEATETVTFTLDGASYEIDVNDQHAKELRDALEPFVNAARKVGGGGRAARGGRRGRSAPARSTGEPSSEDVRQWAREQGHTVSARGRISREVMDAYRAAHR